MKNRRLVRKIIALILVMVSLSTLILGVCADTKSDKNKYSSLESEKKAIQDKISKINSEIAKAKSEKASAEKQKKLYDEQITELQGLIGVSNQLIDECDLMISEKTSEIAEIDKKIEDGLEIIKRRMIFSQERGDMEYIEFVLGSSSITDLFSRVEVMGDLFNNDQRVLDSLKSSKDELAAKKEELEETRKNYEALKAENEQKKAELEAKLNESIALIKSIENDEAEYTALKSKVQAEKEKLDKEMADLAKKIKEAEEKEKNVRQYSGDFIWPVPVRYSRISQYYKGKAHTGLDIPTNHTPVDVYASAGGKVLVAQYHYSYGNYVVIYHGSGKQTLYAHLSKINVKVGQEVSQGQVIGISGTTGHSTGIHVHFMFYVNGSHTDPLKYVKQP